MATQQRARTARGGSCSTRRKVLGALPLLIIVSLAAVGLLVTVPVADASSSTPTTDPERPLMVAMGDSFISGEGTGTYLVGTATTGKNTCHRSNLAYPFLVARERDYRLVATGCSGAVTNEITDRAQHPASDPDVYGGAPQISYLQGKPGLFESAEEIDIVLLSIGGNDANFDDIVKRCLTGNCLSRTDDWLADVRELTPRLEETYRAIGDAVPERARLIVVPYPDLIAPGSCLGNQLTTPEVAWVSETFLPELWRAIDWAATGAGWEVADTHDAFLGARICEDGVSVDDQAANIFKFDRGQDDPGINGDLVRGSFHPKALGHQLLADTVDRLLATPAPDLEPLPSGSRPPTPPPAPVVPPPGTVTDFPRGTPCRGPSLSAHEVRRVTTEQSIQLAAGAGSLVCYREWARGWRSARAGEDGMFEVSTDRLVGRETIQVEVLTRSDDGAWTRTVLLADPAPPVQGEASTPWLRAVAPWLLRGAGWILVGGIGLAVVALALWPWVACWRVHRRGAA